MESYPVLNGPHKGQWHHANNSTNLLQLLQLSEEEYVLLALLEGSKTSFAWFHTELTLPEADVIDTMLDTMLDLEER